jgi:tetratricopeptide (TPR) repeat protein
MIRSRALWIIVLFAWAPVAAGARAAALPSPADRQIGAAELRLSSGRPDAAGYNALAIGFTRKARETGDTSFYERALEALEASLALEPRNPEASRIAAWVRMGRHEFTAALRIARRASGTRPGDTWSLAVIGDALMELGRYDAAADAYQELADLRPGPVAYSRVAYYRELIGDLEGAIELLRMALSAADRRESEDRAWLLVQIGHLHEVMGDLAGAEADHREALRTFPDYHYALAALARVALDRGRPDEAATLAAAAIQAAPHAERYLLLADALHSLGREAEARAAENTFEGEALLHSDTADNENHDLVLFYLERRKDPGRALALARREARARRDILTLDRLAWALHHNGRGRRAARLMRRILETGTREPLILRHGAVIAASTAPISGTRE